jgi:hypothetical protein
MTARGAIRGCALIGMLVMGATGCGLGQPSGPRSTARAPSPEASAVSVAQTTHERPSPPPGPQTASGAAGTPAAAIRAFTSAYINWTADDVTQHMRWLAAGSVGQARSAMQLAAAQTAGDYELRQGGISNGGTIEAIAPQSGRKDRYVVVTLERTSATVSTAYQGLRPAWHLALATVVELSPGRWVLSGWQPES